MNTNQKQQFAIIFAFIMITWSLLPLIESQPITTLTIATSCILFLIGIAYPLVVFKPLWSKSVIFIEGAIFFAIGAIFLNFSLNIFFMILGSVLIISAILAYQGKFPKRKIKNHKNLRK